MSELTITGLSRVPDPKPNKGGSTVLAWFDCQANGFALHGCAFVRTSRRGLTVWPPKIEGKDGSRRSVTISDERLRRAMVDRAQETYRALGGTDGEWIRADDADTDFNLHDHGLKIKPKSEAEGGREEARPLGIRRTVTKVESLTEDDGVQRFLGNA
ncbi:MAG: hypothetical protein M0R03_04975 [Novosphingobium sp.]|nr:hypothetical protein [Novosphingobium sp.]